MSITLTLLSLLWGLSSTLTLTLADVHLYLFPNIIKFKQTPQQQNSQFCWSSRTNRQILFIPINRLLLLFLVVLTTKNMDGATSPLLHMFSFTSQNLVLAATTHSNCYCTTESRSFRPQCHTIVIQQPWTRSWSLFTCSRSHDYLSSSA
jgi:hypothetical protein